jgi:hypothetical protein
MDDTAGKRRDSDVQIRSVWQKNLQILIKQHFGGWPTL